MALLVALAAGCAHLPQPCEYYPNAVFSGFVANWYGEHLRAMRESSLHVKPRLGIASTYRFLYLPTFSEPLLFRLEVSENGKAVLVTKRTNGKGGYGAGRLTSSSTTSVSPSQLEHFRQLIQKLSPRSMPAEVPEMRGLDGSEWILEVTEGDSYHVLKGRKRAAMKHHVNRTAWVLFSVSQMVSATSLETGERQIAMRSAQLSRIATGLKRTLTTEWRLGPSSYLM